MSKKLGLKLISLVSIDGLHDLLKKLGVDKCKEIYNGVFNNQHNGYSMTLFSGIVIDSIVIDNKCWPRHRHCRFDYHCNYWNRFGNEDGCCNPNFLYTGDFEPQNNIRKLRRFYNPVWEDIASIQVPHHGSKFNFDATLYEYPIRGIVSVGNDNPYHHPDIDTLIKIQEQGCYPVIVTEDKSSMKIYHYEYC